MRRLSELNESSQGRQDARNLLLSVHFKVIWHIGLVLKGHLSADYSEHCHEVVLFIVLLKHTTKFLWRRKVQMKTWLKLKHLSSIRYLNEPASLAAVSPGKVPRVGTVKDKKVRKVGNEKVPRSGGGWVMHQSARVKHFTLTSLDEEQLWFAN